MAHQLCTLQLGRGIEQTANDTCFVRPSFLANGSCDVLGGLGPVPCFQYHFFFFVSSLKQLDEYDGTVGSQAKEDPGPLVVGCGSLSEGLSAQ